MRQKRTLCGLFLAVLMGIQSSLSLAEGLYVGSTWSHYEADYDGVISLAGGAEIDDQGTGFKVITGYRLHQLFSMELQYADFGDVSLTMPNGSSVTKGAVTTTNATGATVTSVVESTSYGIGAMLTIPFRSVKPYLKYGLHSWDTSRVIGTGSADIFAITIDGTDLYRGVGFDIPISDLFFTRLEYETYDFEDDKISLVNFGLFLQF